MLVTPGMGVESVEPIRVLNQKCKVWCQLTLKA
jgi:hypothetical protein